MVGAKVEHNGERLDVRWWDIALYRFIRCIILLAGLSLASSASAALISVQPATETFPAVISIEGEIAFGDERDFVNQALGLDSAIVVLASPGGNTFAAIEIGKAIRLKNFVTLVDNNEQCASACALIWLAGVVRFMGPEAQLGFTRRTK